MDILAAIALAEGSLNMLMEKGSLNEEIAIKLIRRDVLLLVLSIDLASNHAKGTTLSHDLEHLRGKLVTDSRSTMEDAAKAINLG